MSNDDCRVGFSTRIGIGDVACSTAQIALLPVRWFVSPRSMPTNHVEILLVTLTLIRAVSMTLVGGKFRLPRPTLVALGKSTYTLLPNAPELALPWLIELVKPFLAAYAQGDALVFELQSKAVPGVKFAPEGIMPLVA